MGGGKEHKALENPGMVVSRSQYGGFPGRFLESVGGGGEFKGESKKRGNNWFGLWKGRGKEAGLTFGAIQVSAIVKSHFVTIVGNTGASERVIGGFLFGWGGG